jgi:hypothetical protein
MADTKNTDLAEHTSLVIDDQFYSVDISDTTMHASGTSKRLQVSTLLQYIPHGLDEISITGATTATIGRMHVCSGTSADYTLTLPAASGNTGKIIGVRMSSALTKLVTVDANSTELIDGSQTRIMHDNEAAILMCDGTNWAKIGGKTIPMTCRLSQAGTTGATSQSVATTTVAVVQLNTIDFDSTVSMADLANDRIIARRPGKYLCNAILTYESLSATSGNTQCRIHKNGTLVFADSRRASSSDYPSPNGSSIIDMAVSDYVDMRCHHNAGSNQEFYQDTAGGTINISLAEQPSW